MSGQEPEDVALAIHDFFTPDHERDDLGRDVAREFIVPLLTRLVRAGQRRELEAVAREMCDYCRDPQRYEPPHAQGLNWSHFLVPTALIFGVGFVLCEAPKWVHARLALLREE